MDRHFRKVNQLKRDIVKISHEVREGHIASSFSVMDILVVLYYDVLRYNRNEPDNDTNDRVILSKGHAAIAQYVILSDIGFVGQDELKTFGCFHSRLGGHPDRNKVPGIDVSTGSLGHGLPNGVGLAYGCKLRKLPCRIYVVVGDGEMNEGSMWESMLIAAQLKLDNLTCIVDNNHSITRAIDMGDIAQKFEAFGWNAITIDGHDPQQIKESLGRKGTGPRAIVADTVKGKGCTLTEGNPQLWHHKSPDKDELEQMLRELSI